MRRGVVYFESLGGRARLVPLSTPSWINPEWCDWLGEWNAYSRRRLLFY
jgi:hypothetical protein